MKANPRRTFTILLTVGLIAAVTSSWLWWKTRSGEFREPGRHTPANIKIADDQETVGDSGKLAPPMNGANQKWAVEQVRQRAAQRAEQIRAAQEQLRGGAQPGEVKEPGGK